MKDLSRREFFSRFTDALTDQVDLSGAKKVLEKMPRSAAAVRAADWIAVGRMAEFAPGVVREVKAGAVALTIRSRAEGLWAERLALRGGDHPELQRVALRTENGGVILANLSINWPNSRMLSHLTGEAIDE